MQSTFELLYILINKWTAPLYTIIYQSPFFFFDYWSIIHLINGFLITTCAKKYSFNSPLLLNFFVLLVWEIVEMSFVFFAINVFKPEIIPDQITDIVIGMIGGVFTYLKNPFKTSFVKKKTRFLFNKQKDEQTIRAKKYI